MRFTLPLVLLQLAVPILAAWTSIESSTRTHVCADRCLCIGPFINDNSLADMCNDIISDPCKAAVVPAGSLGSTIWTPAGDCDRNNTAPTTVDECVRAYTDSIAEWKTATNICAGHASAYFTAEDGTKELAGAVGAKGVCVAVGGPGSVCTN